MGQPVKVIILGQEYLIRSDEDPDQIQEIAAYVNEKLDEVRDKSEGLSDKKIAILAALNIAGEYFHLLNEGKKLSTNINERMKKIIIHIDDVIESSSTRKPSHNGLEG